MFFFRPWYWIVAGTLILLPLLFNLVVRWIVVPIRLHRKSNTPAKGNFQPTRAEQLTPELRDFLAIVLKQFAAEGFEVRANVSQDSRVLNNSGKLQSTLVLLVNPATNDIATAIGVVAPATRSLVASVSSRFGDGTSVATGFSPSPGIFPRDPKVDSVNFAWVRDAGALAEAHRRRMAALGFVNRPRVAPPRGTEVEYLERERDRELRRVVAHGEYYFDAPVDAYRLTWKGAFLHAWKLTEPVKTWRIGLRDRRARRVWRRLGMDQWRPPAPAAVSVPAPAAAVAAQPLSPSESIAASPDEPALARLNPDLPDDLRYEVVLAEGEVRQDWANGVLTVRAGAPTVGRFLARQWRSLFWLVFLGGAMAIWARVLLLSFLLYRQFGSRAIPMRVLASRSAWSYLPLVVTMAFFIAEVWKLIRGVVIVSRGPVILTASPAGLTYRNVPAWRGSGRVARGDLDSLRVALHAVGLRSKTFRLEARLLSPRGRVPLLIARDMDALQRAADAMGEAMGIHSAAAPPPASAPAAAEPTA